MEGFASAFKKPNLQSSAWPGQQAHPSANKVGSSLSDLHFSPGTGEGKKNKVWPTWPVSTRIVRKLYFK